jgi:hypothetical protein
LNESTFEEDGMNTEKTTLDDEEGWHGEEWETVVQLWHEMETRRLGGENAHPIGSQLELPWTAIWLTRNKSEYPLTPAETVDYFRAVVDAGTAVINAWLECDVDFFKEFARRLEIASGKRKLSELPPIYETIIETAFGLFSKEKGNPTKQQVRAAVEKLGFKGIDWTKAWKKCRLTFLPDESISPKRKKRQSSGIRSSRTVV